MKSVLISIQPKWCELIASGRKTIEVRKTAPKEVPFKAYVYCTKGKQAMIFESNKNACLTWTQEVIGEFICDNVDKLEEQVILGGLYYSKYKDVIDCELNERTCLDNFELLNYSKSKPLYAWHISELKIYDEPRELSEFVTRKCVYNGLCGKVYKPIQITRPPKCYQYVTED